MNVQNYQDLWNPSDEVEGTAGFASNRTVSPDMVADQAPVDEPDMHETPAGGAADDVGPHEGTVQEEAAQNEQVIHLGPVSMKAESIASFLSREEAEKLRMRWNEIQIKFVDEPQSAVHQADALVTEVIEKITRTLAAEHSSVESQWDKNVDAST